MDVILDVAFVIFPTLGYWAQLRAMQHNPDTGTEGFSPLVCIVLLIANILRIVFWLLKKFSDTLMWQSLTMIGMQLFMVYNLCLVKTKYTVEVPEAHAFLDRNHLNTFRGTAKACIILFLAIWLVSVPLSLALPAYVEALGLLAVLFEAMLAVPQVVRNHQRGTTEGLSAILVLTWVGGDAYKLGFCLVRNFPLQFIACAALQLALDAVVCFQMKTLPSIGGSPGGIA